MKSLIKLAYSSTPSMSSVSHNHDASEREMTEKEKRDKRSIQTRRGLKEVKNHYLDAFAMMR